MRNLKFLRERKVQMRGLGKEKPGPAGLLPVVKRLDRDTLETLKQGVKGMGCSLYTRTSLMLLWLIEVKI